MFETGALAFREFMADEPLPLASIHSAVLEFLRGRTDAVLFGAQAVNAYVGEPRMTQDIDLLSSDAAKLADEIREYLSQQFHIAVRVREIGGGRGYRVFQMRESGDRHLVAVRQVALLPAAQSMAQVLVMAPPELIASKVAACHQRRGKPKSGTDWRDVAMLVLAFPDLKRDPGPVGDCLQAADASDAVLTAWRELVAQDIQAADDEDGF